MAKWQGGSGATYARQHRPTVGLDGAVILLFVAVLLAVPFSVVVFDMVAAGSEYRAENPDEKWVAAE